MKIYSLFLMRISILCGLFLFLLDSIHGRGLPEPSVKNLRARYDHKSKSIYVEWDYDETTESKLLDFYSSYC